MKPTFVYRPVESVDKQDSKTTGRVYDVKWKTDDHRTTHKSVTTILNALPNEHLVQWRIREDRKRVEGAVNVVAARLTGEADPVEFMLAVQDQIRTARKKQGMSAGTVGTKVHAQIEAMTWGMAGPLDNDPRIQQCIKTWLKWMGDVDYKPVATEFEIVSSDGWAGTCDALGYVEGKLSGIDWKTSSDLYPEYDIQGAAYFAGLNRMIDSGMVEIGGEPFKEHVEQFVLVHLPKSDKPYKQAEVKNVLYLYDVFKSVIRISDWYDNNGIEPIPQDLAVF